MADVSAPEILEGLGVPRTRFRVIASDDDERLFVCLTAHGGCSLQ